MKDCFEMWGGLSLSISPGMGDANISVINLYKSIVAIAIGSLLIVTISGAKEFKVASYNIENLFDLQKNGYEYKDYIPYNRSQWNTKALHAKIKNISRVIKDMDADIVALQEIENLKALKALNKRLQYPYYAISNRRSSPVRVALLSQFAIKKQKSILVDAKFRDILKVTVTINNKLLDIYVNHWPSKRHKEQMRMDYAIALKKELQKSHHPFLVIGDLNSHYNESGLIRGQTGINDILNTKVKRGNRYHFTSPKMLNNNSSLLLYNLWLQLPKKQRYNYQHRGKKYTIDHILVSKQLFDKQGLEYVNNSFGVFMPSYVFKKNNQIYRWQQRGKYRIHMGSGYSDHLPIYALFNIL